MLRTLLALTLPATLLVAQGGPGPERAKPVTGERTGERPGRAQIAARLHSIRSARIQASLGVTEALARSIADRWGKFDQDSHARRQGMRMARARIQEILVGPGSDDEKNQKVSPTMNLFSNLQKEQKEAKQKFEEDIQKMLTPIQQCRFVLLMEEFQRNLAEALPEGHRDHGSY